MKSAGEQAVIRRAADVHRRGVTALIKAIRPGSTEADLVAALSESIHSEGAAIYFASVSSGPMSGRWTSTPLPGFGMRMLEGGDLVRFDTGIVYEGYLSDFGRAKVVGGEPRRTQQRLIDVLHAGLEATIHAVRPGVRVRDVVAAGEEALAEADVVAGSDGVEISSTFPVHWGHGLGLGWERPWMTESEPMTIEAGMYLAIERALTLPGTGTVAAEQTLLVNATGAEVLTAGNPGFWD